MERHRLKPPACRSPHRGIVVCLVTPCLSALSWANATPTATPTLQPPTPAASATFRPNFQPLEINGAKDTRVLRIGTNGLYRVDVPEGLDFLRIEASTLQAVCLSIFYGGTVPGDGHTTYTCVSVGTGYLELRDSHAPQLRQGPWYINVSRGGSEPFLPYYMEIEYTIAAVGPEPSPEATPSPTPSPTEIAIPTQTPEATLLPTPTPEVAEEDSINTLLGKNRDDARAMDRNGDAILDVSDVVYTPREMRLSPP